jgi:Uma2 family endonuclease
MGVVTTLPRGRSLTVADLDLMPDDGHRYELIDGVLLVTPAPSLRHQTVSMSLSTLLYASCPPALRLLAAPFDVVLTNDTGMQPDILVARRTDFTEKNLPVPPLLAVEILSPSTRSIDLLLKRERYERAGVPSYWVVDPVEPSLTAWELREGTYAQVARVTGDDPWTPTAPYVVTIAPSRLLA